MGFLANTVLTKLIYSFCSTTKRRETEFRDRLQATARTFGIAAAMRLKTERDLLAQYQRAPGLPSSNIGLETVLGLDETIEFEDILNGLSYLDYFSFF